jgi:hypothetical protein
VGRAVGVMGLAHDESDRMPLRHQPVDLGEARLVRLGLDRAEGIGDARGSLAHREADALGAEIEADEGSRDGLGRRASALCGDAGAGGGHHACPASSDRFAAFTPSALIAAW